VLQVGVNTKAVARAYAWALESLGNELLILRESPPEQIDVIGIPLLGEAIRRMRDGKLDIQAGYDGEFGRIRIFSDAEKRELLGQRRLFAVADSARLQGSATSRRGKGKKKNDRSAAPREAVNPAAAEDAGTPAMAGANPDQQQAIDYAKGPLLIVAGPGTGKTYTLTRRIAHLIQERGIPSEDILAVTFTEKAAEEMRTRLIHLLDDAAMLPLTATFHGLCWRLLRDDPREPSFRILDNEERLLMLARVLRRLAGEGHAVTLKPKAILKRIVDAKQQLQGPHDDVEAVAPDASPSQFSRAYRAYQKLLEDRQLLDFEDLIFMVAKQLATDPAFRDKCRKRFRYVFVDEYQDLNYGQYRLIRELVPPEGNLCVIGDPDQAIYGFRGSDVAFFNRFVEDYPSAAVMHLTRNYRSVETILEASWQVIRQRETQASGIGVLGSRLYSRLQGAPQVAVVELPSAKAEAVAVGQTIERAVGGAGFLAIDAGKVDASAEHDSSFADFAVLYRTAAQADMLASVFDKAGIPYQVASRRRYHEQPLTSAILALLRVAAHTATPGDINRMAGILEPSPDKETVMSMLDHMDALGLTPRQLLDETDPSQLKHLSHSRRRRLGEALSDWRQLMAGLETLTLDEQIGFLADRSERAPDDAHGNRHAVERLLTYARGCHGDRERFLATIALHTDADMLQARVEKVTLTTMHAAKGLEFPVVFVVGCEDGLIPLRQNGRLPEDLDEERRLFYVALTRAREQLYLTWARKRRIFGRQEIRVISPFVGDIAPKLLKHHAPRVAKNPGPQQIQLKLF
ncbi:MAG: UvrD-helicase domain-containing protein, partial [Desulfobacterales bacterium]|jgi:superfamily I DNA/RNA helicase